MIHKNYKKLQTGLAKLTAVLTAIVNKMLTLRGKLEDGQKVKPSRLIEKA